MTSTTPTSLETLLEYLAAGQPARYIFFWGHRPRADGRLGDYCFSQWSEQSFTIDGVVYPTAEHYMMAEKARLFKDHEAERQILDTLSPGKAKGLGRKIQGFSEEIWTANRFQIVVRGNYAKFSQNPRLMGYLLATNDAVLVEASPTDRIWGIGLERTDPRAQSPHQWEGLNLLGFALMEVRLQLARL